jgi:fluoride exporter
MSAVMWVAAGLLGGAGALARFLLDGFVDERFTGGFPYGTFAVNISGALALGLLAGVALDGNALVLAGSATLGSYTTFSTWMLETDRSVEDDRVTLAVVNVALTLLVGIGAAELGRLLGEHL